jgi:hypothetical protein
MLSVNFISIPGYDMNTNKSSALQFIIKEQKKAALQLMSTVCGSQFSGVLKTVAN